MALQPLTMMRCERCRAIVSSTEAPTMIRQGTPCGVCGGPLTGASTPAGKRLYDNTDYAQPPERRLLCVLREARGRPVGMRALAGAGIVDPASVIYELERAGHRIERAYEHGTSGWRSFLGYRLR